MWEDGHSNESVYLENRSKPHKGRWAHPAIGGPHNGHAVGHAPNCPKPKFATMTRTLLQVSLADGSR
eukprot:scaffold21_cov368-Prasinococcus_capsulatus_cf.AAC.17